MKGLTKTILITLLAVAFLSIFPQKIPSSEEPGTYYCVVSFLMENKDRYCYGPLSVECRDEVHIPPWGNWGVDSNLASKWDGNQFQGWKYAEGHIEWNSCTIEDPWRPPDPNCYYYNTNWRYGGCTEQESPHDSFGENVYAYGSEWFYLEEPEWDDG